MTNEKTVLDADKAIAGRLAAYTAKKLLEGHEVVIVNSGKAVFSGNPKKIVERYSGKRGIQQKSNPDKSPKFPRRPDLFLKKVVFGMLPTSRRSTRKACMSRLRCYLGVPKQFQGKAEKKVKTADEWSHKPVSIEKVCLDLGWQKGSD